MELNAQEHTDLENWPQDETAPPDQSPQTVALWGELTKTYAPIILSDIAGDNTRLDLPDLSCVNWCALYPLAIYILESFKRPEPRHSPAPIPIKEKYAECSEILEEFWKRRTSQIATFHDFLHDWKLTERLNIAPIMAPPNPTAQHSDKKIIHYREFTSWTQIEDAEKDGSGILRWNNLHTVKTADLWKHRVVASRAIDLLCSELLDNAFCHSGGIARPAFIIAKTVSKASASMALDKDQQHPHLTPAERILFKACKEMNQPLLQLCIADSGGGFSGNKKLIDCYRDRNKLKVDPIWEHHEADLIQLALSGTVSTKTRDQHRLYWNKYLNEDTDLYPTTHGLAEVARYVRKMRGVWRIHSNSTIVELFHYQSAARTIETHPISPRPARKISGCLNYFTIPLFSDSSYLDIPFLDFQSEASDDAKPLIVSGWDPPVSPEPSYAFAYTANSPQHKVQVSALCDRIVESSNLDNSPLIIDLSVLEDLVEPDLTDACVDIVRAIHIARMTKPVFILGAGEHSQSVMSRYVNSKSDTSNLRMLPFIHWRRCDAYGRFHELCLPSTVSQIAREIVEKLIFSPGCEEVVKSDTASAVWGELRNIYEDNLAYLSLATIGDQDKLLRSRNAVPYASKENRHLLLGGTLFSDLRNKLIEHKAIAPYKKDGYYRLGSLLPTYIHLGRLWADVGFQGSVLEWLKEALAYERRRSGEIATSGRDLIVLAYLHPAIGLAHELIRSDIYTNSEIIEITRTSQLRWDFDDLLSARGTTAIILIDVVLSGNTVTLLVEMLQYLRIKPLACFSVISLADHAGLPIQEYTYCRATKDNLEHASKMLNKQPGGLVRK